MALETVAQYFTLSLRYLYDLAEVYDHWLVVPVLQPTGRYEIALLDPDGGWLPLPYLQGSYDSAEKAIKVGKAAIDLWMTELETAS